MLRCNRVHHLAISTADIKGQIVSPAELERFRKPAEFASQGGAIAQPPLDWLEEFPNLAKFLDRIHARPAYKRALERGGTYAFGS